MSNSWLTRWIYLPVSKMARQISGQLLDRSWHIWSDSLHSVWNAWVSEWVNERFRVSLVVCSFVLCVFGYYFATPSALALFSSIGLSLHTIRGNNQMIWIFVSIVCDGIFGINTTVAQRRSDCLHCNDKSISRPTHTKANAIRFGNFDFDFFTCQIVPINCICGVFVRYTSSMCDVNFSSSDPPLYLHIVIICARIGEEETKGKN